MELIQSLMKVIDGHELISVVVFLVVCGVLFTIYHIIKAKPLDECICGQLYPDKFFKNGGKCKYCGFNTYE